MATVKRKLPRGVKRIIYFVRHPQPARPEPAEAEPDEVKPKQRDAKPAHSDAGPAPSDAAPASGLAPPPQVAVAPPGVVITHIQYDGKVGRVESDEYIELQNQGPTAVDLSGWRVSAGNVGQNFRFPAVTMIQPQQRFRIYTDEVHPETGGFSFGSKRAIWNNHGDVGLLFNRSDTEVSRWAYGRKAPAAAKKSAAGTPGEPS